MGTGQASHGGRFRWRRWAIAGAVVTVGATGALAPVPAGAVVASADLSVGVTYAPDAITAPGPVTFTVTASNAGPDTATGVVAALGFDYPIEPVGLPAGCRVAASYRSVLCELGDLASGASESVDLAMHANASGLYTLPAAVASDTPDPDTEDRVANAVVLVKRGPSQAVRYIRGIFPIIVNRAPNTATTDWWAARWKAESMRYPRHLEKIPAGIINSNEYRRIRIREAYQRILGRPADAAALEHWVGQAAKGMSFETIDRRLITSNEFTRKAGPVQEWITRTYQAVLGRQPTSVEARKAFESQGQQTFAAFVLSVQHTTEARDRVIAEKFQDTLGAAPSSFARFIWQDGLRKGRTAESLWAELLASNDVVQRFPYTEDDYADLEYGQPIFDFRASADARAAAAAAS